MIEHLYSSTLFALAAVAAAFCLRCYSARYRYAILLLAVLRFAVPTGMLTAVGRALAASSAAPPVLGDVTRILLRFSATPVVATAPAPGNFPLLLALWLAGSLISLALCLRQASVEYALACSKLEADALQAAKARMRLTARVDLRIVARSQAPGVRGLWRSCIVLPEDLAASLQPPELEAVLAHELAHIARRDNLWAAAVRLVVSVFWFHPLLWWIERRLLIERELACDEQVLASGAAPSDYVSGILKICRMAYTSAHGYAGATGSNLKQRMEQIMSTNLINSSSTTARAAIASLLAIGILAPLAVGFQAARETRIQPVAGSGVTSAVIHGTSGVDHSKAMLALSRLYSAPLFIFKPAADTPYSRWLTEDVAYIVSQEEASAFGNLNTNEERKKFIGQFWQRRDPTPGTPENEFQEEHYRRTGYANQHFSIAGPPPVPGWETARGRTYILLGPPDEIEQHPGVQAWLYRKFDKSSDSLILTFETN